MRRPISSSTRIPADSTTAKMVGEETFAALSWLLERRHPDLFSRPEIQLNMIAQHNEVENNLVINIAGQEYAAIESEAEPIREKIAGMIAKYRSSTGNGDSGVRDIEASPVIEAEKEQPPNHAPG
jgi:hypothetical protein